MAWPPTGDPHAGRSTSRSVLQPLSPGGRPASRWAAPRCPAPREGGLRYRPLRLHHRAQALEGIGGVVRGCLGRGVCRAQGTDRVAVLPTKGSRRTLGRVRGKVLLQAIHASDPRHTHRGSLRGEVRLGKRISCFVGKHHVSKGAFGPFLDVWCLTPFSGFLGLGASPPLSPSPTFFPSGVACVPPPDVGCRLILAG